MAFKLPTEISRQHLLSAIAEIDNRSFHPFGESTGYDVLHNGKCYAPKAVVGIAASQLLGIQLKPQDFKGGIGTLCFSILHEQGFTIVSKNDIYPFPDEFEDDKEYFEGSVFAVKAVRYERDPDARKKCIAHYGTICAVCETEFIRVYGLIGEGFIHVHHLVPLSLVTHEYVVDPIRDLRPVCPNCHAMLHKRTPPFSIEELRTIMKRVVMLRRKTE